MVLQGRKFPDKSLDEQILLEGIIKKRSLERIYGEYIKLNRLLNGQNLNNKRLRELYLKASSNLTFKYGGELIRTPCEKIAFRILTEIFPDFEVVSQAWIGPHCSDIYIPEINLIIEVNGSIHFGEPKMRKDVVRDFNLMNKLGLIVMEIENQDVTLLHRMITGLRALKKQSPYKRKQMLRKIYITTALYAFPSSFVYMELGLDKEAK